MLFIRQFFFNFLGRSSIACSNFLFTPFYFQILGVEAIGLVIFFNSLLSWSTVLDFGIGGMLAKKLASSSDDPSDRTMIRNLLYTSQFLHIALGLVIGALFIAASPFLAQNWFQNRILSDEDLYQALVWMGIALVTYWPSSLFCACLNSCQRQVVLSSLFTGFSLLRHGIMFIILLNSEIPTLALYFKWQTIVNLIFSIGSLYWAWKFLPSKESVSDSLAQKAKWDWSLFWQSRKFAFGIAGISISTLGVVQLDKWILAKYLTLEQFGRYSLLMTLGYSLYLFVIPFYAVFSPRITKAVAQKNWVLLSRNYHLGSQALVLVLISVGVPMMFFSKEVILLWTGDPLVAEESSLALVFLICGTILNGLLNIPLAVQIAMEWTSLAFWQNTLGTLIYIPCLIFVSNLWGITGSALSWFLLNSSFFLISLHFFYNKILKKEKFDWYFKDFGYPVVCSLLFIPFLINLYPGKAHFLVQYGFLALTALSTLFFLIFAQRFLKGSNLSDFLINRYRSIKQKE